MFKTNFFSDIKTGGEVFLGNGVQKISNKFTEEHPCQSVTSIRLNTITVLFTTNKLDVGCTYIAH